MIKISEGLELPLEAVTETFAVLGRRGSGKTYTGAKMAEEMLEAGQQVVIIDPLDVWYGLRSDAAGTGDAFPIVIFGGKHGDVELGAKSGETVADAILETGTSAILSLRHLSKTAQRKFVGDFCERLYHRKGEEGLQTPFHLFVDEADAFIPQRPQPDGMRAYGAIDTIVRRGRSSGFGTTLISQRAAVIAKDVLTQTEILICHQTTGPQDRKALEAWVEQNDDQGHKKDFLESLAKLGKGQAWFWSPAWLDVFKCVQVGKRKTFDSSSTPKAGAKTVGPKKLAPVDIEALRDMLAAPEEEDEEPKTRAPSKELAAENRRLKLDLAAALERENMLRIKLEKIRAAVDAVEPAPADDINGVPVVDLVAEAAAVPTRAPRPARAPKATIKSTGDLGGCPGAILTAIVQHGTLTLVQAAIVAGYAPKSGTVNNAAGTLRKMGLIEGGNTSGLSATDRGKKRLGHVQKLPTGKKLAEHWLERLGGCPGEVLRQVLKSHPRPISLHDAAVAAGYKTGSGTVNNAAGKLRKLCLVSGSNAGMTANERLV